MSWESRFPPPNLLSFLFTFPFLFSFSPTFFSAGRVSDYISTTVGEYISLDCKCHFYYFITSVCSYIHAYNRRYISTYEYMGTYAITSIHTWPHLHKHARTDRHLCTRRDSPTFSAMFTNHYFSTIATFTRYRTIPLSLASSTQHPLSNTSTRHSCDS